MSGLMSNHEWKRMDTNPEKLRITSLRIGVILNFKQRKLQWERIAL